MLPKPSSKPPDIVSAATLKLLLLVHAAATLFMCGLIWIVQVVHYPLFAKVGVKGFAAYEASHTRLITFIVFPAMVAELITAFVLVANRPDLIPAWQVWSGLGLVGVIWASTGLLQVPMHAVLSGGFDAEAHARLVSTNWIRTIAWSLRSVLACAMLWPLLQTA